MDDQTLLVQDGEILLNDDEHKPGEENTVSRAEPITKRENEERINQSIQERSPDDLAATVLQVTETLIGGLLNLKDKLGRVSRDQKLNESIKGEKKREVMQKLNSERPPEQTDIQQGEDEDSERVWTEAHQVENEEKKHSLIHNNKVKEIHKSEASSSTALVTELSLETYSSCCLSASPTSAMEAEPSSNPLVKWKLIVRNQIKARVSSTGDSKEDGQNKHKRKSDERGSEESKKTTENKLMGIQGKVEKKREKAEKVEQDQEEGRESDKKSKMENKTQTECKDEVMEGEIEKKIIDVQLKREAVDGTESGEVMELGRKKVTPEQTPCKEDNIVYKGRGTDTESRGEQQETRVVITEEEICTKRTEVNIQMVNEKLSFSHELRADGHHGSQDTEQGQSSWYKLLQAANQNVAVATAGTSLAENILRHMIELPTEGMMLGEEVIEVHHGT
ncbi:DNA ligase 1-like [Bombina bombina]|uniref:DNA ligase 1-like n=1 Tax=Bombina bombina TaxID=8345 RepID=UPI00235A56B8|nr:DNA ligase 1-like [Bombina bombina]